MTIDDEESSTFFPATGEISFGNKSQAVGPSSNDRQWGQLDEACSVRGHVNRRLFRLHHAVLCYETRQGECFDRVWCIWRYSLIFQLFTVESFLLSVVGCGGSSSSSELVRHAFDDYSIQCVRHQSYCVFARFEAFPRSPRSSMS